MGEPKSVGPYNIEGVLGEGGMGKVYRAVHRDGRRVALKVSKLTHGGKADPRFNQEAELLRKLAGCPNVLGYFDRGVVGGVAYIATELLQGESLRDHLESKGGKLSESEALEIMRQACVGVAWAHDRGILHRDLKPENLFVTKDLPENLVVKVIDFGLAKDLERVFMTGHHMTAVGARLGTPMYMPPEQYANARDVDERADVFGLGCILFELLTGRNVYREGCQDGIKFPKPADVRQDVWSAAMRATNPNIDARQPSVREFWEDLQRATAITPAPKVAAPATPEPILPAEPLRRRQADIKTETLPRATPKHKKSGHGALMPTLLVLAVISVAGLKLVPFWRSSPPAPPPTSQLRPHPPTPAPQPPAPDPAPPPCRPSHKRRLDLRRRLSPCRIPSFPTAPTTAAHPLPTVVGVERNADGRGYVIPARSRWGDEDVVRSRPHTCVYFRRMRVDQSRDQRTLDAFHEFCDGH